MQNVSDKTAYLPYMLAPLHGYGHLVVNERLVVVKFSEA